MRLTLPGVAVIGFVDPFEYLFCVFRDLTVRSQTDFSNSRLIDAEVARLELLHCKLEVTRVLARVVQATFILIHTVVAEAVDEDLAAEGKGAGLAVAAPEGIDFAVAHGTGQHNLGPTLRIDGDNGKRVACGLDLTEAAGQELIARIVAADPQRCIPDPCIAGLDIDGLRDRGFPLRILRRAFGRTRSVIKSAAVPGCFAIAVSTFRASSRCTTW